MKVHVWLVSLYLTIALAIVIGACIAVDHDKHQMKVEAAAYGW